MLVKKQLSKHTISILILFGGGGGGCRVGLEHVEWTVSCKVLWCAGLTSFIFELEKRPIRMLYH